MKTIEYKPKLAQDRLEEPKKKGGKPVEVKKEFDGHVVLRLPGFSERSSLLMLLAKFVKDDDTEQLEALKDDAPEAKKTDYVKTMKENLPAVAELVEATKQFYESVHLVNIETGTKYESFEDLETDPDANGIVTDVAMALARGIGPKPSKN